MKRAILQVLKVVSGIAGVVFWFVPLATWNQVVIFEASIAVIVICIALSNALDKESNTGYWPSGPIDWSSKPEAKKE
jgi:hypothetical protein